MTEEHVKRVKALHERELLDLEGVQGVGIGGYRGRPAIMVYVDSAESARRLGIPKKLDHVPVVVEQSGVFSPY